ncbi:MAG: hypothetical protein HUJ61_07375 [Bacilli bacterium]|nr:hypothetical protein [Bacilli bacterium]
MAKFQENNKIIDSSNKKDNENIDDIAISKKEKTKKIIDIVVTCVEAVVVVFLLILSLITMSTGEAPDKQDRLNKNPITNTSYLPVLSDSMAPTFKKGDLVFVENVDVSKEKFIDKIKNLPTDEKNGFRKGAIITYYGELSGTGGSFGFITHRIIKIEDIGVGYDSIIYTRGDAESTDAPLGKISLSSVRGIYKGHFDGAGNVIMEFQTKPTLMFCVIVLPLILLFIWNGYSFIRVIFQGKKEEALEIQEKKHQAERAAILEEAKRQALEELRKEQAAKEKKKE